MGNFTNSKSLWAPNTHLNLALKCLVPKLKFGWLTNPIEFLPRCAAEQYRARVIGELAQGGYGRLGAFAYAAKRGVVGIVWSCLLEVIKLFCQNRSQTWHRG